MPSFALSLSPFESLRAVSVVERLGALSLSKGMVEGSKGRGEGTLSERSESNSLP